MIRFPRSVVVGDLVHEGPDQEHPPAADPHQVLGVDRPVEARGVEARPLVLDRVDRPRRDRAGRRRGSVRSRNGSSDRPARGQAVELALVVLAEVGADFEVAVIEGVAERLLERDARPASGPWRRRCSSRPGLPGACGSGAAEQVGVVLQPEGGFPTHSSEPRSAGDAVDPAMSRTCRRVSASSRASAFLGT